MARTPPDPGHGPAPDRLVTVAVFSRPLEAHLARARLESEGIECVLADEHVAWLYSGAAGGAKLQVRSSEAEHARACLREATSRNSSSADWITADLDAPRCPSCGSLRLDFAEASRRVPFASWPLLGIPRPRLRRIARCRTCGHRWRARRARTGDAA